MTHKIKKLTESELNTLSKILELFNSYDEECKLLGLTLLEIHFGNCYFTNDSQWKIYEYTKARDIFLCYCWCLAIYNRGKAFYI